MVSGWGLGEVDFGGDLIEEAATGFCTPDDTLAIAEENVGVEFVLPPGLFIDCTRSGRGRAPAGMEFEVVDDGIVVRSIDMGEKYAHERGGRGGRPTASMLLSREQFAALLEWGREVL